MKRFILAIIVCLATVSAAAQSKYVAPQVKIANETITYDGVTYYLHVVAERETLYSICRAYDVTEQEIFENNSILHLDTKVLRAGDLLIIPYKKSTEEKKAKQKAEMEAELSQIVEETPVESEAPAASEAPATAPEKKPERRSRVKPLDTIQVLDQDSVVVFGQLDPEVDTVNVINVTDTVNTEIKIFAQKPFVYDRPSVINAVLIMPFNAAKSPNEKYLNFYLGALVAAKDLGTKGITMNLSTYDTFEKDYKKLAKDIENCDVIIGPVSMKDINEMIGYCPDGKFLISPLDTKTASLAANKNIVLASTPATIQIDDSITWLLEDKAHADSVCVIKESGYKISDNVKYMISEIGRREVWPRFTAQYEVLNGLGMADYFDAHTYEKFPTEFLIASEHDTFIKDAIRNINVQAYKKKNVSLYGPAKMRAAELEDLCNANLHASVAFHIDYSDPSVVNFVKTFRALYKTEPDSYAFHGYDTMYYFVSICSKYGRNWPQKLSSYSWDGLQTSFLFDENDGEGYINKAVRRITYAPGFQVARVR